MQVKDENEYTYAFLESLNVIIIWKDGKQVYLLHVRRSEKSFALSCNCPSGIYRGYCKHEKFASKAFDFTREVKPRDHFKIFAEEYYTDWYEKNWVYHN